MIPTYVTPYNGGELRIGWASWDHGRYKERSIKWAYPDKSGKISRGAPELPFDVLASMFMLAYSQGELENTLNNGVVEPFPTPAAGMRKDILREERKRLSFNLLILQRLMVDLPWVDWKEAYSTVEARWNEVNAAL